ncbi:hypothetical protein, partial [Mesorhizobium sp. M1A.F.Ca.IN.020.32.1.1]|uniref:hypothetical protein n=1 Tax=Mesorhizobium sp. M1A.F.Ca.IN.020.32.1.1 TaxID=2496763 RepID=UPI0019D47001
FTVLVTDLSEFAAVNPSTKSMVGSLSCPGDVPSGSPSEGLAGRGRSGRRPELKLSKPNPFLCFVVASRLSAEAVDS